LVDKFDQLNPETLVDDMVQRLQALNMLRDGDLERAAELRSWFVARQLALPNELEHFRHLKDSQGNCAAGLDPCNDGTCNENCQ
jgi:hypothetical protein